MAWNGSGVFSRLRSWVTDQANGLHVQADLMDQDTNDIVSGLNNALCKDGQNSPSANLPMGGFKHTGVADGTARNHYASLGQVQDGSSRYCVAGGTANALTLTLSPVVTALVDGMEINFKATATCAAGATTAAANGVAAKPVKRPDGTDPLGGDITAGRDYTLRYVAATDSFVLRGAPAFSTASTAAAGTATNEAVTPSALAGWTNALTAATPATNDYLPAYDVSAAAMRKMAVSDILALSGGGIVDPTTTVGDIIVRGPSGLTRLAKGNDGSALSMVGGAVTWSLPVVEFGWSATDKDASITLSDGNRIATGMTGNKGARATRAIPSTAKVYWEVYIGALSSSFGIQTGVMAASHPLAYNGISQGEYMGQGNAAGWGVTTDGRTATSLMVGQAPVGSVTMHACYNGMYWYGVNGIWQASGSPSTGASPLYSIANTVFPGVFVITGGSVTIRTIPSQWSYAPPSGFGAAP